MSQHNLTMEQKKQFAGILEIACQELEITPTQFTDAEQKYTSVGRWLSESDDPQLRDSSIYSQGSIRIATTVKPLQQDEFDVDLICHVADNGIHSPADIRNLVGKRLNESATYAKLLEPLNRGWRINYANEFHLDITPVIDNPSCNNGGVLVPDKELSDWKPSNPSGYAEWFDHYAEIQPAYSRLLAEHGVIAYDMEPLPEQQSLKGVLRRGIQLMKRHRDLYFQDKTESVKSCAPISIIITTLATHAYRHEVTSGEHDNDIDLLMGILRSMPAYIEEITLGGVKQYAVMNPSTDGENFAEKWNIHPERASWFFVWHTAAVQSLEKLIYGNVHGVDQVANLLTETVGEAASKRTLDRYSKIVATARDLGVLGVGASGGIAVGAGRSIPKNTFYGK